MGCSSSSQATASTTPNTLTETMVNTILSLICNFSFYFFAIFSKKALISVAILGIRNICILISLCQNL